MIQYCEICDKFIDLDTEVEHFELHEESHESDK